MTAISAATATNLVKNKPNQFILKTYQTKNKATVKKKKKKKKNQ